MHYIRYDSESQQRVQAVFESGHVIEANRSLQSPDLLSLTALDDEYVQIPAGTSPQPGGIATLDRFSTMFFKHTASSGRIEEFYASGECGCGSSTDGKVTVSYTGGQGVNGVPYNQHPASLCDIEHEIETYEVRHLNTVMSTVEIRRANEFTETFAFDTAGQPLMRVHQTHDVVSQGERCCTTSIVRDPETGEVCRVDTKERGDCCVPDMDADPVVNCLGWNREFGGGEGSGLSHCTTLFDHSGQPIATYNGYSLGSGMSAAQVRFTKYSYRLEREWNAAGTCSVIACPQTPIQCGEETTFHTIDIDPGVCTEALCDVESITPPMSDIFSGQIVGPGLPAWSGPGMGTHSELCFCQSEILDPASPVGGDYYCPLWHCVDEDPDIYTECVCSILPAVTTEFLVTCETRLTNVLVSTPDGPKPAPSVEYYRIERGTVVCYDPDDPCAVPEVQDHFEEILIYRIDFIDPGFLANGTGEGGNGLDECPSNPSEPIVTPGDPIAAGAPDSSWIHDKTYDSRGIAEQVRAGFPGSPSPRTHGASSSRRPTFRALRQPGTTPSTPEMRTSALRRSESCKSLLQQNSTAMSLSTTR